MSAIKENETNPAMAVGTLPYVFVVNNTSGAQVLRVESDGALFWRDREIKTDDEFRAWMVELHDTLIKLTGPSSFNPIKPKVGNELLLPSSFGRYPINPVALLDNYDCIEDMLAEDAAMAIILPNKPTGTFTG